MANYVMQNSGQDLDETITAYKNGTIAKSADIANMITSALNSGKFKVVELNTTEHANLLDASSFEMAYSKNEITYLHYAHENGEEESAICIATKNSGVDNCVSQLLITSNGFYRRFYPENEADLSVDDPSYFSAYMGWNQLAIPDALYTETYTGTIPQGQYYTEISNVGGDSGGHIIKTINVKSSSKPVITSFCRSKIYVSRLPGDSTDTSVNFEIVYHAAYQYQAAVI